MQGCARNRLASASRGRLPSLLGGAIPPSWTKRKSRRPSGPLSTTPSKGRSDRFRSTASWFTTSPCSTSCGGSAFRGNRSQNGLQAKESTTRPSGGGPRTATPAAGHDSARPARTARQRQWVPPHHPAPRSLRRSNRHLSTLTPRDLDGDLRALRGLVFRLQKDPAAPEGGRHG